MIRTFVDASFSADIKLLPKARLHGVEGSETRVAVAAGVRATVASVTERRVVIMLALAVVPCWLRFVVLLDKYGLFKNNFIDCSSLTERFITD